MNLIKKTALLSILILFLGLFLTSCEIETEAYGRVKDFDTGEPIVNAHVMQVAVMKKETRFLCESYTDSTGFFEMSSGLAGFGPRKVALYVIVEKDSFHTLSSVNQYDEFRFRMHKR